MALLTLKQIHLSYGDPALLDSINLSIERGERICLLGRNGEGKSTLLKIIAGTLAADEGERVLQQGAKVSRLTQEVPADMSGRVFDVVADGLGQQASLVKAYHEASIALAEDTSEQALDRLAQTQQALEDIDGWQLEQRTEQIISRMELNPDTDFCSLSGGLKRRTLLARALVSEPDLLLLDEPTNHLDIESISWLEAFLLTWPGTLVFITHDRGFLQRLATRIVALDRGTAADFPGDYANYLRRRDEMDNAEAKENARFDKKMAQEETWIRQGIKARRTRNEGRVRQLMQMREQMNQRRNKQGTARLQLNAVERSGKLVCEAEAVSYAWSGKPVIRDFSCTILRGDRIGIIGPNGCGKSTLLNLLLGKIKPDQGRIELGTKLEVAYFDQLREQLDLDKTVLDNVAGGSDTVNINGKEKHVIGYLQDFLFSPKRARQPVSALSGGERNRLLLAKLFTQPANVLVLDEPTNDLDLETLELLEELILGFDGTLLLVSHDRVFLDRVVTSTLVFEGDGRVNQYVGGYEDWLRQRQSQVTNKNEGVQTHDKTVRDEKPASKKKLSYKHQRELEALPLQIEQLEQQLTEIEQQMADPGFYRANAEDVSLVKDRYESLRSELAGCYRRWEELDG